MSHDPRPKASVARRSAEGKPSKEIIRCLKRYIARELYRTLIGTSAPTAATRSRQEAAPSKHLELAPAT
jgi:hypothetical protein